MVCRRLLKILAVIQVLSFFHVDASAGEPNEGGVLTEQRASRFPDLGELSIVDIAKGAATRGDGVGSDKVVFRNGRKMEPEFAKNLELIAHRTEPPLYLLRGIPCRGGCDAGPVLFVVSPATADYITLGTPGELLSSQVYGGGLGPDPVVLKRDLFWGPCMQGKAFSIVEKTRNVDHDWRPEFRGHLLKPDGRFEAEVVSLAPDATSLDSSGCAEIGKQRGAAAAAD